MEKFYKQLKNISCQAQEISSIVAKNIPDTLTFSDKLKEIINPLIEANRIWTQNLEVRNPFKELNLDFSKIEKNTRIGCEKMLSNGFYPYKKIGTSTCLTIVNLDDVNEIEKVLSEDIEFYVGNLKNTIIKNFNNYSKELNEIYELYNNEKYRLCILSLINTLSQIFNNNFEHCDFTETDEIMLKNYNIMSFSNEEYYQFMPYCIIYDNSNKKRKKYYNTLLCSCRNKKEEYKKIPYNRNAILHGYSKDFGNKINCLRWFSVLLNANDIFEYNKQELK